MKAKIVRLRFQKVIDVELVVPEDWSDHQITQVVSLTAEDGLRDWDEPEWDWQIWEKRVEEVNGENVDTREMVFADDDGENIVAPCDATWWKNHGGENE